MQLIRPAGIRALVFDMDGTLVDSMPAHARSWETFCRAHAIDLPVAEILRRTTGRNGVECIRELFGPQVDDATAWRLTGEKEAAYREAFARWRCARPTRRPSWPAATSSRR